MKLNRDRLFNSTRVISGTVFLLAVSYVFSLGILSVPGWLQAAEPLNIARVGELVSQYTPQLTQPRDFAQASEFADSPQNQPATVAALAEPNGLVKIQNFNNYEWVISPLSNVEVSDTQLQLKPDTCISNTVEELSTDCRILFSPTTNNILPDQQSILKSLTIQADLGANSELIVDHHNASQEFQSNIGILSGTRNRAEFNVPSSYLAGDFVGLTFWNKLGNVKSPELESNNSSEKSQGIYCSTTYTRTSTWNSGYIATIALNNPGTEDIQNWQLEMNLESNNKISGIWNATLDPQGSNITISNAGYNRIIKAGQSVDFGYSVSYNGKIREPKDFKVNGIECDKNVDIPSGVPVLACEIEYKIISDWKKGYTAEVTLKNTGPSDIFGWRVGYQFPDDEKITSLWNGSFVQSKRDIQVSDANYNGAIASGKSVSYGLSVVYNLDGSKRSGASVPTNFNLNGVACDDSTIVPNYDVQVQAVSVDYLHISNLQSVAVNIDIGAYKIVDRNSGKIYFDIDRDSKLDMAIDREWVCMPNFPGASPVFPNNGSNSVALNRADNCYLSRTPSQWTSNQVALPKGEWLLSFDSGNVVIPFVIPDNAKAR